MSLGSEVFIGVRPEDAGKEFDYPVVPLHTVRYFEAGFLAENAQITATSALCFITWNCYPEFSRRSDYIHAA